MTIVLPVATVRGMLDRARKLGLAEGGRFDPRDDGIFLWSAPPSVAGARPIASVGLRWDTPGGARATIELIAWDREVEGALDQMCRGVELLAGALTVR